MDRIHGLEVVIIVFVVSLLVAVVLGFLTNIWWGAALFLTLFVPFIFQGLNEIPNQPPSKGVLTIIGERQERVVLVEGWHLFPFYPLLYGAVVVDVTKVNQDLEDIIARTGDLAELSFSVGLTWTPNHGSAQGLMQLLDSGGVEGVKNILADVVMERLREWAIANLDWEVALKAQDNATATLIIEIVGLDDTIDHTDLITRIRRGNGVERLETLGITINRINVKGIKVLGELAKAAELKAKELREREAEIKELEHIAERVKVLIDSGLNPEAALEAVQTERGKVVKTIDVKQLSLSPEAKGVFEKALPGILRKVLGEEVTDED